MTACMNRQTPKLLIPQVGRTDRPSWEEPKCQGRAHGVGQPWAPEEGFYRDYAGVISGLSLGYGGLCV